MKDFLDIVKNIKEDREKQSFVATPKDLSTIKAINPLVANCYAEEIYEIIVNNILEKLYEKNQLDPQNPKIKFGEHISICTTKQLKEIQSLIDKGANIENVFTIDENTKLSLLSIAMLCKDYTLCDLLIKNGANKCHKFSLEGTAYYPVHFAEQNFSPLEKQKFVELLKSNYIPPLNQQKDENAEMLFSLFEQEISCFSGFKKSTLDFIQNTNFNPNYIYKDQNLMEFVLKNKMDYRYALALLDKGFNVNVLTIEGKNTITLISSPSNKDATKHNQEIIDKYIQNGLDVNQQDSALGKTLVMYACDKHNLALFRSLVHNGAKCDKVDFLGNDIWTYADNQRCYGSGICKSIEKRYPKELSFYAKNKTLLPALDDKQKLFEYIKQNKPHAEFLVPTACNYLGKLVFKKSGVFDLFNSFNIELTYNDEENENILQQVNNHQEEKEKQCKKMFYFLINHPYANVDANEKYDFSQKNALAVAIDRNKGNTDYYEFIEALLKKGADPNRFSGGCFPLERAILNNDKKTIQILMEYGAKPLLRYAQLECHDTTKQFYSNLVKGNLRKTSPDQSKTTEYVADSNNDKKKQDEAKAKIDDLFNEINIKF